MENMSNGLDWQQDGETLTLIGRLDRDNLLPLWQEKARALRNVSTIDVSHLHYIDSVGLALLVHFVHSSKNAITLSGATEAFTTLMTLYNVQKIMPQSHSPV